MATRVQLEAAFAVFDWDGSCWISKKELYDVLSRDTSGWGGEMSNAMSQAECNEIMEQFDTNGECASSQPPGSRSVMPPACRKAPCH